MKKLLSALLVLSLLTPNSSIKPLNAENSVLVDEASTLEEKALAALEEVKINTDLNTVVSDLYIPTTGLFNSTISWKSSNDDYAEIDDENGKVKIHRPAKGEQTVQVTLTAKLTVRESKDVYIEKEKEFNITILPLDVEVVEKQEAPLFEDFSSYSTGEEIGEYLSWNLSSSEGITSVVEEVPNNNKIDNQKILQINSKKTAQDIRYTRDFYISNNVVFEAYTMFWGQLNGMFFELGANGTMGPTFGISHESFYYNANGEKAIGLDKVPFTPKEGVWYKFRIEVNTAWRTYSLKLYKMDGSNEVYELCSNTAYSTPVKYLSQLRIRVKGGDKIGQCYLSDVKIDYADNLPILEGVNPNREDGIGKIENFEENILYIKGEEEKFDDNILVYNRYDENELYVEDVDYTLESEIVSSTENQDVINYMITLLETNETKLLTQTIYKEEATGLPEIFDFKGSHLARKANADGVLSSKGHVYFKGNVRRADSTIYYGLATSEVANITASDIKNNSELFLKSGNFAQTTSDVYFEIEDLDLKHEYYLYVVAENANGYSQIYHKEQITEVINITTCEEFYDMTVNVNTYKNDFKLLNDLDFTSYNWVCDPSNTLKFQGNLDGQGYTISNLNIQSPYRKAAVFFEITNSEIKDINFDNCNIEGLQDSAVIAGYSNGGDLKNISITNSKVSYNGNAGSEGYFAMVIGRLHKDTTNMTNIFIDDCEIDCNKYTGALTGNINKGNNCVLNAKNIYCDIKIRCDGAAIGLVGRNRGTLNIENVYATLNIRFAKKEMAVIAGHNKEGAVLNAKNVIGTLYVGECTQPTYFNNFIGSHDPNTSSYTFENLYFFEVDYSHLSDSLIPVSNTRDAGTTLSLDLATSQRWWEENTFIDCFETNPVWSYDEVNNVPVFTWNKKIDVSAEMVNEHISLIKNDYSGDDHYHIYKALKLYDALSADEKAKVNYDSLLSSKEKYESLIDSIKDVINSIGGK